MDELDEYDLEQNDNRTRSTLVRCGDAWQEWATLKPSLRPKVRPGTEGCMRELGHDGNPNCPQHTKAAKNWTHTEVIK